MLRRVYIDDLLSTYTTCRDDKPHRASIIQQSRDLDGLNMSEIYEQRS
jgi:hypothetical protein